MPWDDPDSLRAAIDDVGPERVAAFFCEPVIGAGGVFPPPEGYLEAARSGVPRHGRAVRGRRGDHRVRSLRRLVRLHAASASSPTSSTCAKGITSGYLPLGAVLAAPRVAEPFWAEGAGMWRHGYTYSGHAAVAAAALANIDILEREGLPTRAKAMEGSFLDALKQLTDHDLVEDVRGGVGLLAAVQLRQDLVEADPALGARVGAATREAGVLVRPLVGGALAVSPPLTIDDSEIQEAVDGIRAGLDAIRLIASRRERGRRLRPRWMRRGSTSASARQLSTASSLKRYRLIR